MQILGIASETSESGIAVIEDSIPRIILEEERLNREKHTLEFPSLSVKAALERGLLDFAEVEAITTPWNKQRMISTFAWALLRRFPFSLAMLFRAANPTQKVSLVDVDKVIRKQLKPYFDRHSMPPVVGVGHHESHAAMYFISPFDDATIIVMDGYGDDASTSVFTAKDGHIERQWRGNIMDSLGAIYTLITRHLGFEVFEEGTVMALAACGDDSLVEQMRDLVQLEANGQFNVNMSYFSYDSFGMIRPFKRKFFDTFGPARRRDEPITEHHKAIARALQELAEDVILHVSRTACQRYHSRNLLFVGGVAQNCVASARILSETDFEQVWIPPCASDTGTALGSALWHYHQTLEHPRSMEMTHSFYGLEYGAAEIRKALQTAGLDFEEYDEDQLLSRVSRDLADDKIVGWFQGRHEVGPRALGNRSILASPLKASIRDKINERIKYREPFRPFAPSILQEYASDYFDMSQPDPFMTFAPKVRATMVERIPAAVHIDGTARLQTVNREANPLYHALLEAFHKLTGVPILLNTSFNKQEPIVATPQEAISCFLRTDMDTLVIENFYCSDRPQEAVERARSSFDLLEANLHGGE